MYFRSFLLTPRPRSLLRLAVMVVVAYLALFLWTNVQLAGEFLQRATLPAGSVWLLIGLVVALFPLSHLRWSI